MYEGHSRPIWAMAMYEQGILASGGEDCLVKLWDTNQHSVFKTLIAHSKPVWGLSRVADDYLATASWDMTVKIWTTKP